MTGIDHEALQRDTHKVQDLLVGVVAAELHLTHFATRYGKESAEYQGSLRDFGTAWRLLKTSRNSREFVRDVQAS